MAEKVLKTPVRIASSMVLNKMPEQLAEPEFSTVVGLAMYAHRTTAARMSPQASWSAKMRAWLTRFGGAGALLQRH